MEPDFFLIVHADTQTCITVCYAWPTAPYTLLVALVHVSALASVTCQAFHALTTAFCGIGLTPTPRRRSTSTFQ
eukprot:7520528-Prorocentrum_lima.AAC.1